MKLENCFVGSLKRSCRISHSTFSLADHYDHLEEQQFSPIGSMPCLIVDMEDSHALRNAIALRSRSACILIGVDSSGNCPEEAKQAFDVILSSHSVDQRHAVFIQQDRIWNVAADMNRQASNTPLAATTLCRVLRIAEHLPFSDALDIESLAYSMLLGGAEFSRWRNAQPHVSLSDQTAKQTTPVEVSRTHQLVTIELNATLSRNAMSHIMRDALFEALAATLDDPTCPRVIIKGRGSCFSTGGALEEFGRVEDLALAHTIRTQRSLARLIHELGERVEVHLHGACIGAGIEIPAAANMRLAAPGTFVQLPELRMGLIPGAGGTATLSRVIGRHRTAYLALRGRRTRISEIEEWGLARIVSSSCA